MPTTTRARKNSVDSAKSPRAKRRRIDNITDVDNSKTQKKRKEIGQLVEQTSDNRILVPSKSEPLRARKQTAESSSSQTTVTSATGNVGVFAAAAERANIEAARAELMRASGDTTKNVFAASAAALLPTSDDGAGAPNSIMQTIARGRAVEQNAHHQGATKPVSAAADSGNEMRTGTKRKRKKLLPTPTSGLTATQLTPLANSTGAVKPSPNSKRCCKSDLKRCLRVGDWIENIRVNRKILEERNGNQKLLAQFDGENFIDYQTEEHYRSISDWVKRRMVDLGALSPKSNISGWDYAVVHREEANQKWTTTTLRLLVEQTKQKMEMMRSNMKEQRSSGGGSSNSIVSPLTPIQFGSSTPTGFLSSNQFGNTPQAPQRPQQQPQQQQQQQQQQRQQLQDGIDDHQSLQPFFPPTMPIMRKRSMQESGNSFGSVGQATNEQTQDDILRSRLSRMREQVVELENILYTH